MFSQFNFVFTKCFPILHFVFIKCIIFQLNFVLIKCNVLYCTNDYAMLILKGVCTKPLGLA